MNRAEMETYLILLTLDFSPSDENSGNMATSKPMKESDPFEEGCAFVRRFVYDVMVYTLPKCGFPEMELPYTDREENVYERSDFIETVGMMTLRISLLLRQKWMRVFISRLKSYGFNEETLSGFMETVVLCCPLSWIDTNRSVSYASLALCNELVLFLYNAGITNVEPNAVLNSVATYLIVIISPYSNIPQSMEKLLGGGYANVPEYTRWLTNFIDRYAIPYGATDVSDYFFGYIKHQWAEASKQPDFPEDLTTDQLRDQLGFLPSELFNIVAFPDPFDLPEDIEGAPAENLLQNPTSEAVEGMETCEAKRTTRSENISEQGGEELGSKAVLGEGSLAAGGASQASQGAIPKIRKATGESRGRRAIPSDSASEQSVPREEELGIEGDLEKMSLATEEASQSKGATAKRKKSKKSKKTR